MPRAVSEWIAKNLWAILALIGGTFQGYNVGTGTMAEQSRRLAAIEERNKADDAFHHCLVRTVDWLKAGGKAPAPCELE